MPDEERPQGGPSDWKKMEIIANDVIFGIMGASILGS